MITFEWQDIVFVLQEDDGLLGSLEGGGGKLFASEFLITFATSIWFIKET